MTYNYNWDLKNYFYNWIDDENLENDLKNVIKNIQSFIKKYKWKIQKFTKPEEFLGYYQDDEKISLKLNKIFHYLFYKNSLDTQDQVIIKKTMEVENMFIEIQNQLLFVQEEFKKLWKNKLKEFSQSPILKNYKYLLEDKIKSFKHILSKKEEKLLNELWTVDSQVENLYNEFHSWLNFKIKINWENKTLTEDEVRSLRSHKEPKTRRLAYKTLREVYWKKWNKTVLTNIYSTFVKQWILSVKLRKYKTVMEPRNISEWLDNKVVDLLMEQVIQNYNLFQRYVKIKAKLLWKKSPLPIQDLQAPVIESRSKFTKDQAIEKHLDVMKDFDETFYNYSVDLLKKWRVDFEPKQWKRWWAFASYSKWQESFVLLNFTWKLNDISTLSHEFWHAIHGHLSQIQPEAVYDSPLSLAETASIFNEMLLSEYLLKDKNITKEDKISLLENKLWDIFATIFRQIQYVDFERQVHTWIQNNQQFSHKDYCKLWRSTQEKMSWKTIKFDVKAEEESWWSMIPHIFHTPFYCYAYAFGNILTFSLYNKYKTEWKEFVKDYKQILSSGGSIPPKELLAQFWIDITKKKFYQNAFKEIEKMLDNLESLID